MIEGRKFLVRGRVQGVWFRESTRQQAERLGIDGHAVNLANGAVEVVAYGSPESLGELETWLQQGPPLARVSSVDSSLASGEAPDGFSTG